MSAAYLRETAALMRSAAASVPASPWGTVEGTMGKIGMVTVVYGAAAKGEDTHPPVVHDIGMDMGPAAEYVKSWHPAVALAVADWLDACALVCEVKADATKTNAMTVARAYRGETP